MKTGLKIVGPGDGGLDNHTGNHPNYLLRHCRVSDLCEHEAGPTNTVTIMVQKKTAGPFREPEP